MALRHFKNAPYPTGSSTQGVDFAVTVCAAIFMACICSEVGVPKLILSAAAILAKLSASKGLSIMAGEAPAAKSTFAA